VSSHDAFLDGLLATFPRQVFLAGAHTGDLGLKDSTLRVFFPDFHWMSATCLERYSGGYQFTGNAIDQPTLAAALTVLEQLKAKKVDLEVFQLGDRFDLWREMTRADPSVRAAYDRLRRDASISGLADRLDALGTIYIRGNHDAWLDDVEDAAFTGPRSFEERETANHAIFLTHGHRYDNIEMILNDHLKATLVGLCPKVKPGINPIGPFTKRNKQGIDRFQKLRAKASFPRELYPTVRPDGARLVESAKDVEDLRNTLVAALDVTGFFHGSGDRNDFEHISYLTFGGNIMTFEENHHSDHRLYVVGHTHHARILVDSIGGRPLVTMDCGGWIENCTVVDPASKAIITAPSRQIGVQCGNDLRIYQLGGNPQP
jgi:UDP-2,3-diacylglucosamine pyrophosphatase LpxH